MILFTGKNVLIWDETTSRPPEIRENGKQHKSRPRKGGSASGAVEESPALKGRITFMGL